MLTNYFLLCVNEKVNLISAHIGITKMDVTLKPGTSGEICYTHGKTGNDLDLFVTVGAK